MTPLHTAPADAPSEVGKELNDLLLQLVRHGRAVKNRAAVAC
jgi:hypothetical protein